MIIATSVESAHFYGDILPSMYRLRYKGFKERQSYDVPCYKGMEYDAYDTPATTYLVWRDEENTVRGCARLFPTTLPYMIEEIWPELLGEHPVPKSSCIWEASRLCIDKSLPIPQRKRIHSEILCGLQEVGLENNIQWMIGVMQPLIWRGVFVRSGWPIEFLSEPIHYDSNGKEKIVAGKMPISKKILNTLYRKFGIYNRVIHPQKTLDRQVA